MHNNLISIIIPTFNRVHLICATLDSVIAQTYTNWQCIIVDDNSTDNTLDVLKKYNDNRIEIYARPRHMKKGPSSCRNFGLSKAKGENVIFLDSDDLLKKSCLETRLTYFKKYFEFDCLVFSMGHILESGELTTDRGRMLFQGDRNSTIRKFLTTKYPWNTTRPIYKTKFLQRVGGFNEELMVYEDPELAIRSLLLFNIKYKTIDITDCYYRCDNNQQEKWVDENYRKLALLNLYNFNKNIFKYFSKTDLMIFKIELKKTYYSYLLGFCDIDNPRLHKDLTNLFYSKINFSLLEKSLIYTLIFSIKNKNIKGTYLLRKYSKILLNYINN